MEGEGFKMSKIQAVLLAGGEGTRLRPYTTILPKPLLPLGDYPIAEIIIRQFQHFGIERIAVSTGYLAGLIEAYFGDGNKLGVNITYVHEDHPLGTAGAIALVDDLEDDFLVVNGDVLTDLNFADLLKFHKNQKATATLSVKDRKIKADFGVIEISDDDTLQAYVEKPEYSSYVSMGINVFNIKSKNYLIKNQAIGIPELMKKLKESKEKVSCYKMHGLWYDLGRIDDLQWAQDYFEKNKEQFLYTS